MTKTNLCPQGFYDPNGDAVYPEGLEITASNIAGPIKQRVRAPQLVIIEFILDALPHQGTAGQFLHLSLLQNYSEAPANLHHEQVFFEVAENQLEAHALRMARIVKGLENR